MRYLVTMELNDINSSPDPREMATFIENVVLPSLGQLAQWEKAGTVRGGILAGRRGQAFIVDVDSHEALGDLLRQLPIWTSCDIDVTPIESFEHRLEAGKQMVQKARQA